MINYLKIITFFKLYIIHIFLQHSIFIFKIIIFFQDHNLLY